MDLERLGLQFWEQGYLVLEKFFNEKHMDEMDNAIREHFGDDPQFWHEEEFLKKSKTEVIPWFPQNPELNKYDAEKAAPFDQLEGDTRFAELTRALLGENWSILYCMVMFSRQGTAGQAWHQDCSPDIPAQHNLNRLVYTRDLSTEIGGQTVIMPGSHRMGVLPVGDPHEDMAGQVVLNPKKGPSPQHQTPKPGNRNLNPKPGNRSLNPKPKIETCCTQRP